MSRKKFWTLAAVASEFDCEPTVKILQVFYRSTAFPLHTGYRGYVRSLMILNDFHRGYSRYLQTPHPSIRLNIYMYIKEKKRL